MPAMTAMTTSRIHMSAIVRFGTPARVRRRRSSSEVASEMAIITTSITQPAQSGMLLF